jgi:hypothetical protein
MRPESREARKLILQLRKFHLQSTLVGARMHRKDVKDQAAAINHFHFKDLFKPALLGWRELVISDQ